MAETPPVTTSPAPRTWEKWAFIPLLLIILLGAYFRFTGLDWDGSNHLHPDERFLTMVAIDISSVSSPLEYLRTSTSSLNPYNRDKGFYVYGNFPMTVTRYVAEWVTLLCERTTCRHVYVAYDGIHLVGRFLSAMVDLVSILFTFFIGRRLYDWRVGLLGALFLAAATMPIQQSHFFTMDNWAAALTTLTLYTAVRVSEKGEYHWYALFGLGAGLTIASRINVAPLAGMIAVAAAIWLARQAQQHGVEKGWGYLLTPLGSLNVQQLMLGGVLAATVTFLTFRLAQPYAFADATIIREQLLQETGREPGTLRLLLGSVVGFNPQWRDNMDSIQSQQSPDAAAPPATQWTNRAPIIFPWTNMVLWGMGLPAGIIAWIGFFVALWRILRARPDWLAHALPVVWIGGYFLFAGTRWVKSIRYMLPIYPFLLLLAGWLLTMVWDWARQSEQKRQLKQIAAAVLACLTIIPTLLWANAFVNAIYRQPVTRIAASQWMYDHIPSAATLLYTVNGQPREQNLPLRSYHFEPNGIPLLLRFRLPEQGTVTGLRFNYLTNGAFSAQTITADGQLLDNPDLPGAAGQLQVTLVAGTQSITAEQAVTVTGERQAVTIPLSPTNLAADMEYFFTIEAGPGSPIETRSSVITSEQWDDGLPVRLDGRDAYSQYFEGLQMVTIDPGAQMRGDYYQWLDQADYIVLSSQRALWSLPRIPLTFPLAIRYYEALFSGELGFELINQFHATIQIGPLYISDVGGKVSWGRPPEIGWPPPSELAAEEAFSVYDHPPVWIFAKTDRYSREQVQAVLGAVDLSNQMFMTPGQATQAPNALMLTPEQQAVQQANGTFAELFNPDGFLSQNPGAAAVAWWLAVILLGWANFPLSWFIFRGLPSRGYIFSRIFVLLLLAYFAWLLASLNILPHTRGTLLLGLALLLLVNGAILFRWREELIRFGRDNLAFIGIAELCALALYLILILVRLGNPDVWDVIWGGEKPMDLSYFTAVMKSATFPPYDPWLSGGYINYYYWGYVYVGALTKLLAVTPTVAYNLILPMLFSFTGMTVFSLAYDLVVSWEQRQVKGAGRDEENGGLKKGSDPVSMRGIQAGIAAAILCVLLGNLAQVGMILSTWNKASDGILIGLPINTRIVAVDTVLTTLDGGLDLLSPAKSAPIYPGDWFWLSSRAINYNPGEVQPITEFPFFTFLYGDLHAHMIGMPLTMLALAWAVSLVLAAHLPEQERPWQTWLLWLVGGIMVSTLQAVNTWDYPTFLMLALLAILYRGLRLSGRLDLPTLGQIGLQMVAFVAIFALVFRPYTSNFGSGYTSLSRWPGSYTQLSNYLSIYGLFLFLALTFLAVEFRAWAKTWDRQSLLRLEPVMWPLIAAAFVFLLLIIVLLRQGYWIAPLVFPLVMLSGLMGIRPSATIERRVLLILISSTLFLTLFVEIFVLSGDVGRMNTVFKFYIQAWLILSVVGGASLAWAWPAVQKRRVWLGVLGVLVFAAALYPLTATPAKWRIRMSQEAPKTLDGMVFMETTRYHDNGQEIHLAYDYDALQWMQRNIQGSPVIAEGRGAVEYRSVTSRVAMYTGLPSVIGWDWHQRQQRAALSAAGVIVSGRIGDIQLLYNSFSPDDARRIIEKYGIQYIYVGQLEYVHYDIIGLQKFDQMVRDGYLEEVYRNGGTSIYQVIP
ncbi:MAG: glycosyltransferase family 39 protein [Anaerolineae bacterium]|nr:glycosyltransferase family 39 protein [Anaerolineae bacterium]